MVEVPSRRVRNANRDETQSRTSDLATLESYKCQRRCVITFKPRYKVMWPCSVSYHIDPDSNEASRANNSLSPCLQKQTGCSFVARMVLDLDPQMRGRRLTKSLTAIFSMFFTLSSSTTRF